MTLLFAFCPVRRLRRHRIASHRVTYELTSKISNGSKLYFSCAYIEKTYRLSLKTENFWAALRPMRQLILCKILSFYTFATSGSHSLEQLTVSKVKPLMPNWLMALTFNSCSCRMKWLRCSVTAIRGRGGWGVGGWHASPLQVTRL